jgi:hypothetical protein
MDKHNIFINYYVDWKSTDWLKDLFETNGLVYEGWDIDVPEKETPGRAPVLNDIQNGV